MTTVAVRPPSDRRIPVDRAAPPIPLRHLHDALALAARAVALAERDDAPGPSPVHGAPAPLRLAKVVAETTMLLRAAVPLAADDPAIGRAVDRLARRVAPLARGEELLALLCRDPTAALDRASAHIHLRDLGHGDAGVDHLLGLALAEDRIGSRERVPNHELERAWLHTLWARAPGEPHAADGAPHDFGAGDAFGDVAALLARTCAGAPLDALGATPADLYALTHVVLYATDMGRAAPTPWPRRPEETVADAEAGIAAALDAGNLDLTAELLWTWPLLRRPWSPIATFAADVVSTAADGHGFLPGPGYDPSAAASLAGPDREAYVLRTSYHAAYALGITAAVAADVPIGRAATSVPSAPAAADEVLAWLGGAGRSLAPGEGWATGPGWLPKVADLDPDARGALAGLLVTAALRRAYAADDMVGVREVLGIALAGECLDEPAVRQAAALLRRAAALAALVGATR